MITDIDKYLAELKLLPTDDQIRKVKRDLMAFDLELEIPGAMDDWFNENKDRIIEMSLAGDLDKGAF